MKALLLCPADRGAVEALSERKSLSAWQLFGASLAVHWVEHLAAHGARQVKLITTRRADDLRAEIGDGARWGIQAEVVAESRHLTIDEARAKHGPADDVFEVESLPLLPCLHLFGSYAHFFDGAQKTFFALAQRGRIGAREIRPGIWVGLRAHIGADVLLEAPCWLGDDVHVEKDAHLGPWSFLEDRVWVGAGAEVSHSIIAPETSLGVATSLKHSIACGSTLIDWQTNSVTKVSDSFLLCDLRATPFQQRIRRIFARLAEAALPPSSAGITSPIRIS
jgi:NDP-sugar pyrophosphorylase family protein